jgi:hypothetical protein
MYLFDNIRAQSAASSPVDSTCWFEAEFPAWNGYSHPINHRPAFRSFEMIGFTVAYRHSLYTITIVSTYLAPWNWSSARKFGLKIVHHVVMGFPKARLGCPWCNLPCMWITIYSMRPHLFFRWEAGYKKKSSFFEIMILDSSTSIFTTASTTIASFKNTTIS